MKNHTKKIYLKVIILKEVLQHQVEDQDKVKKIINLQPKHNNKTSRIRKIRNKLRNRMKDNMNIMMINTMMNLMSNTLMISRV